MNPETYLDHDDPIIRQLATKCLGLQTSVDEMEKIITDLREQNAQYTKIHWEDRELIRGLCRKLLE